MQDIQSYKGQWTLLFRYIHHTSIVISELQDGLYRNASRRQGQLAARERDHYILENLNNGGDTIHLPTCMYIHVCAVVYVTSVSANGAATVAVKSVADVELLALSQRTYQHREFSDAQRRLALSKRPTISTEGDSDSYSCLSRTHTHSYRLRWKNIGSFAWFTCIHTHFGMKKCLKMYQNLSSPY